MILQRYILKELFITFALAFTAIVSVCSIGVIFQTFRAYEGMTFDYLAQIAPAALAQMAPWAMIAASSLSVTLVYGRLAADNEINAVRTSGIHVARIVMPALLFGVLLSGVTYFLRSEAAPSAHYTVRLLGRETLLLVLRNPPSGRQDNLPVGRNRLSYENTGPDGLIRPALLVIEGDNPQLLYTARQGIIDAAGDRNPSITLVDGAYIKFDKKGSLDNPRIQSEGRFDGSQRREFDVEDIYRIGKGIGDMTTQELREYCITHAALGMPGRYLNPALTEYYARYARSLAPFFLVMLCTPIGIFVKKGSRLAGMGAALPPILIYIVLMIVGEGMGGKERLSPALGAYGSVGIVALIAVVLMVRVFRR